MTNNTVKTFIHKTMEKRDLEAKLAQIKEEIRLMEPQVTEFMASQGLQNLSFKNLGMAYLKKDIFASLKKDANGSYQEAHTALKAAGLDHLLENGVKDKVLNAYIREMEELGGIPEPLQPHIKVTEVVRPQVKA